MWVDIEIDNGRPSYSSLLDSTFRTNNILELQVLAVVDRLKLRVVEISQPLQHISDVAVRFLA